MTAIDRFVTFLYLLLIPMKTYFICTGVTNHKHGLDCVDAKLIFSLCSDTVLHQKTVCFANRKRKHVVVDGGFIVPYDHLILCTGLQYQVPKPTGLDVSAGATNSDLVRPEHPQPRLLDSVPKNVFVVNDAYEAAVVLYWLEDNVLNVAGACSLFYSQVHPTANLWDPWDAYPPTLENAGTKCIWSPSTINGWYQ